MARERIENQQLKIKCLELALDGRHTDDTKIVSLAKEFYEFITIADEKAKITSED